VGEGKGVNEAMGAIVGIGMAVWFTIAIGVLFGWKPWAIQIPPPINTIPNTTSALQRRRRGQRGASIRWPQFGQLRKSGLIGKPQAGQTGPAS
jgi:hypothetical protein